MRNSEIWKFDDLRVGFCFFAMLHLAKTKKHWGAEHLNIDHIDWNSCHLFTDKAHPENVLTVEFFCFATGNAQCYTNTRVG